MALLPPNAIMTLAAIPAECLGITDMLVLVSFPADDIFCRRPARNSRWFRRNVKAGGVLISLGRQRPAGTFWPLAVVAKAATVARPNKINGFVFIAMRCTRIFFVPGEPKKAEVSGLAEACRPSARLIAVVRPPTSTQRRAREALTPQLPRG